MSLAAPPRPRQRGIALIAVLWGLVLLAAIAASFTGGARTEMTLARNLVDSAQARNIADAAVLRAAIGLLDADPLKRPRADGTRYRLAFGGGEADLTVEDEGGKIDLNRGSQAILRGLFRAVGVEADASDRLVDAVVDWRDRNDRRRLNGAEDPDYLASGRRYGAADQPFQAVEELRQVLGITPEIYNAVAPGLTVYSRQRKVNEETASPLVKSALAGSDGAAAAEDESAPPPAEEEDIAIDLGEETPPEDGQGLAGISQRLRVRSVTIRAVVTMPGGHSYVQEAALLLGRSRQQPYRILAWRQGGLGSADAAAGGASEL